MRIKVVSSLRSRHGRAWSLNFDFGILWIIIFFFLPQRFEILLVLPSTIFPVEKLQWVRLLQQQVCSLREIADNLCKGKKKWNYDNNLSMCSIIIFQFHPYFVVTLYVYCFKTQNNERSFCVIPSVVSVPSSCISYFIDNDIKHVIVYQVVPYSLATQPINDIPRFS